MAGGNTMSKWIPQPEKPVGHNATPRLPKDDIGFIESILLAILRDGYNLCSSYKLADYLRDVATLKKRLRYEGVGFACMTLPSFFGALTCALETGKPSFPGFKTRFNGWPAFLSGLTVRVMNHDDDDKDALQVVYMLCHAFKKLKGPYKETVLRKNIRSFVETDRAIGAINFDSDPLKPIISLARRYVTTLFEGVDEPALKPNPGPGATNTPTLQDERYEPHVLYDQLEEQFPADEFFYAHPWDVVSRAREYLALPRASFPTSRFKFIHKYRSKPRGICIEENETQWCQQALKNFLYKHIETHPMTRGRICFTDQTVNQMLALMSSISMAYGTLDMSEASDRVARELVHRLFWYTGLLEMLDAVSTRVIELPEGLGVDRNLFVQKFAPMGSAVCFPIMAVVHFALIKAIIRLSALENAKEVAKHVYVYGDDIIIPREAVQAVYDYLPLFGMKVNEDKSFHSSYFRESCGVHAYKGKDITPVYNNYTLTKAHERKDTTRLLSLIAKEYGYHKNGFHTTSQIMREHASETYGQLPFGAVNSPLLAWKRDECASEHKLQQLLAAKKRKYDPDVQTYYYNLRCAVPRFPSGVRYSKVEASRALLRWYVKPPLEQDADLFMCSPEDLMIRRRWVPEHALG
jgi:hypothetical protein